jgi:peptidoglycan/xylan/chitin deacetylase (PgdA/CDA1 family)
VSLYLPILMYHQVGEAGPGEKPDLFVAPETFRDHLDLLSDGGYRGVSADQLAEALSGEAPESAPLPDKPVLITLDDADRRTLSAALEALAERSWPGIGYFVAGDPETFPSAGEVGDLGRANFTVGSHCVTHRRLTELSAEAMVNELIDSRRRLEVRVGYPVVHLSYPYGAFARREVTAAREAGYRTAVTVQRGNRHRRDDALRLRRVPMRPDTNAKVLDRYLSRAWHLEHFAKEKLGLEDKGRRR